MRKKIFGAVLFLCLCLCGNGEYIFANPLQDMADRASQSATDYGNAVTSPYGSRGVSRNMLQVGGGENSANASTGITFRDNFLRNIQVYIIGLLWVVSVGVFLYIGYLLFTADGKEEEFRKAWKALAYAVVGLAVIPLAYIAVKIVTGFTF